MQALKCFDCWQSTPVNGVNVPDGDRSQQAAETVAEKSNGYHSQDNSRGTDG
jgi:hypothetical protein